MAWALVFVAAVLEKTCILLIVVGIVGLRVTPGR